MRVSTTPSFRLLLSFVQMDPFGPVAADGIGRQRDVAFLIGAAGRFHGGRVGDGPALAQRRIDHRPPAAVVARLPPYLAGTTDAGDQSGGGLPLVLPAVWARTGLDREYDG